MAANETPTTPEKMGIALLNQKMEQMSQSLARIENLLKDHVKDDTDAHTGLEVRTRALELAGNTRETQINTIKEDVDELRKKDTVWGFVSGTVAVVISLIGNFIFTGKP